MKYLLSTGQVNPFAQDNEQRTPIDRISSYSSKRTELLQLFTPFVDSSKKFPVESYSKLFLCGNTAAGKSTLCQLINYRSSKSSQHTFDPSHCVTVTPLTAGIELHTIESWELGHVVIHDFAGHPEFYSSHTAVLENLMVRSPGVFVLMVDVTAPHNTTEKLLYYWINFIENCCARLTKPSHIIIVGSHIDKLSPQMKANMESFITRIAEHAIRKQHFQGYIGLDCRRPGGENVTTFTSLLSDSCRQVVDRSDSISFYCHVQYSFLRDLKMVAVTTDELCTKLKEQDHPSLPSDVSIVTEIVTALSDKGLILFLQNSKWVIIDQPALLTEVNGTLFAPSCIERVYREIASNTGIITKCSLVDTFPKYNIDMLIGFLTSLEFCHVIDCSVLNDINTNISPLASVSSGEFLFFPSLVLSDPPPKLSINPSFGYCFWCSDPYSFLSTRFLHLLLYYVSSKYCLKKDDMGEIKKAKQEHERVCSIWRNGIYWKRHGIAVLVQMSELNRCVTVLLSKRDGKEAHQISCSIINEIHCLRNLLCPCPIAEYIIVLEGVVRVSEISVVEKSRIVLNNVARAVLSGVDKVEDTNGEEVDIENIINTADIYCCLSSSPDIICKLFDDEHPQVSNVLKALHKVVPDVMNEFQSKEDSSVSLEFVRNHLCKYSIFGNCQLQVSNIIIIHCVFL